MARKKHTASKYDSRIISVVFMFLIGMFILIAPFCRGLFFRKEYIPAVAFISIVFSVFMVMKIKDKSYKIISTYLDISALLIPAAYLISFFFAANARDAFDMFLLYCSYYMLYKLVSTLSEENEKFKNIFINLIIASTFLLSFTSMLHISGIMTFKGAFIGKRLYGLYQYANTSASVLGVGIILSLNRIMNDEITRTSVIYQLILTSLISSFLFTLSRGGYLVLAFVLLLNFFLVKAKAKAKMLMGLFISFLSNSVLIYKFYKIPEDTLSKVWSYYLISIIASALILYAIYLVGKRIKIVLSDKVINLSIAGIAVLMAISVVFLFTVKEPIEYKVVNKQATGQSWENRDFGINELKKSSEYTFEFDVLASVESPNSYGVKIVSQNKSNKQTILLSHFDSVGPEFVRKSFTFTTLDDTERIVVKLYNYEGGSYTVYKNLTFKDSRGKTVIKMEKLKYVPDAIVNRLGNISLETKNASLRIIFVLDGLRIIKDYPIVGAGGGAWRNLYRQYQSIPYDTTEVHNFYVQYGTEVGIAGLAVLIGLLALLVLSIIKSIKTHSQYLFVYFAAMLLFIHSLIDFNLSLAAVWYILWMLIGIINSDGFAPPVEKFPQKKAGILVLILSIMVCLASSSIYYGIRLGSQGALVYNKNKDMDRAIELYEKAIKFDKYNGVYRMDMAQMLNIKLKDTKERKYYDSILEQISLARKYEPYNHKYTPTICNLYLALGKLEEASALASKKLKDEPLIEQSYFIVIDVNYQIADYYLKGDNIKEAEPYLEKVLEAEDILEDINSDLDKPLKLSEKHTQKVQDVKRVMNLIKGDAE